MTQPPFKTLLLLGPKRGPGRVRVYEHLRLEAVIVLTSNRQTKRFPLTATGRAEAKAYAQGYHEQQLAPRTDAALTDRALFGRFLEACSGRIRPRTEASYKARWKVWEMFVGHDHDATATTLEDLDGFQSALLAADYATNQVSAHLAMVKQVYGWAMSRRVLRHSDVPGYKVRLPRGSKRLRPAQYREEEFEALVPAIGSPQDSHTWRAWAALMIAGHQGPRINAILHLKVADVLPGGALRWQGAFDKMGEAWDQPMRDGALSAVLTALQWRARDGYTGPWLFYPKRKARVWEPGHQPYQVQAATQMLWNAEARAGVEHLERRAWHGFRKMVVRQAYDLTKDIKAALDFVHDDIEQAKVYLQELSEEKQRVASGLDQTLGRTRNLQPNYIARRGSRSGTTVSDAAGRTSSEPPVGIEPTTAPLSTVWAYERPLVILPGEHETATDPATDTRQGDPKPATLLQPWHVQPEGS